MKKYLVERFRDTVEVWLIPYKDTGEHSYVNITKGHICPCRFKSIEEALEDMRRDPKVRSFTEIH